jgi:nicotinamide-nucleotide adenylyltransferase
MNDSRTCFYPGRFQPLHNGHAAVIKTLTHRYEGLIIGISFAHVSHTLVNPFTGGERYQIIKSFLASEQLLDRVDLVPIPGDPFLTTWVPFIRTIAPPFQVVYARSALIRNLFHYWSYETDDQLIERLTSGTAVRESMVKNADWKALVPSIVAEEVVQLGGPERMVQLALGERV